MELCGKRVLVIGLGSFGGGTGVVRWLAGEGAEVTVSDLRPAEALEGSLKALAGVSFRGIWGAHPQEELDRAELVVMNPAVPPHAPVFRRVAEMGIPRTSEIGLFLERCPAPIIGITGSIGKSTVTSLTAELLGASGRSVRVGGNIGGTLLGELPRIRSSDEVVLELSSFQLKDFAEGLPRPPRVAVVLNCLPHHLNYHGSFGAYREAKRNLLIGMGQHGHEGTAVLGLLGRGLQGWEVPDGVRRVRLEPGSIDGDRLDLSSLGGEGTLDCSGRRLPGTHGMINIAAAVAAACGAVSWKESFLDPWRRAIVGFGGLPHRLEELGIRRGIRFVNDSKATTPEAVRAALEAVPGPIVLLAGGADQGESMDPLAEAIVRRVSFASLYGRTGPAIGGLLDRAGFGRRAISEDLPSAFRTALDRARAGDCVLLSPGCASYDQFMNYEERGACFVREVNKL
jgi:UDP-N-acetylmuramoylalanine--D-glutamate ligase